MKEGDIASHFGRNQLAFINIFRAQGLAATKSSVDGKISVIVISSPHITWNSPILFYDFYFHLIIQHVIKIYE